MTAFAGSSLLAFLSAGAQPTLNGAIATEKNGFSLDEIIVTARRREEGVEDVPQVVDPVTAASLARYNIQWFQDVQALVPGLTLSNDATGYRATAALRGVNFEVNSATSPTVQFYINDAAIDPNFLVQSMFDVGQIEILRGPQGTLRGRSAPSGAITVTTHKADTTGFGGYVSGTGTDQDVIRGEGAINIPFVSDMLALRVAGLIDDNQFDHVKSVNSDIGPHQHTSAGRMSFAFTPNDAFALSGMYQHLKRDVRSFVQVAGPGALGPQTPDGCYAIDALGNVTGTINCPPAGYNGPVIMPDQRRGVSNQPTPVSTEHDIITGQAEYRFARQRLTYVGGWANTDIHGTTDMDTGHMIVGGLLPLYNTASRQPQLSHELRLASEDRLAGMFDYAVGLFYGLEKPDIHLHIPTQYLPGAFGNPPDPNTVDNSLLIYSLVESHGWREERSAFGSLSWHLTDRTELTGGGRYIILKDNEVNHGLALVPGVGTIALPNAASTSDKRWTPKVYSASLAHRVNDEFLAYLNYGTSWRRGPTTVGLGVIHDPALNQFLFLQPETSQSWEAGFKSMFLDNRALVNLAVYRQKYHNFIYLTPPVTYLADQGSGTLAPYNFQFTANVPVVVKGLDLDTSYQLMQRWNVRVAFSYSDGHMEDGVVPCNAPIPAGSQVALCTSNAAVTTAPAWNANLQSDYSKPVTASLDGYARGLLTYYPDNNRASGESSGFTADRYAILNLYTGVRSSDGVWDVMLFARNITNSKETLTLNQAMEQSPVSPIPQNFGLSGYNRTSVAAPREFGLTLKYAFGSRQMF